MRDRVAPKHGERIKRLENIWVRSTDVQLNTARCTQHQGMVDLRVWQRPQLVRRDQVGSSADTASSKGGKLLLVGIKCIKHRAPNGTGWFYNVIYPLDGMSLKKNEPNGNHHSFIEVIDFDSPLSPRLWLTEENNDVFAYLWSNGTTTLNYTIHCSNSKNVSHFRCLAASVGVGDVHRLLDEHMPCMQMN